MASQRFVALTGALAAAALVAGGCGGGAGDSPEGTVEAFYSGVADGDAASVCELMASEEILNTVPEEVPSQAIAPILHSPDVAAEPWDSAGAPCEEAVSGIPESIREWAGEAEVGDAEISEVISTHASVPVDLGEGGEVSVGVFQLDESDADSADGEWQVAGPGE